MTKQIVIWGAWYGSRNVGDQLLLLAITDIFYNQVTKLVKFEVLTDNADWINEYTSEESLCDIAAIQSRQEIFKVLRAIKKCDLFVIGGGVPFFDQLIHVFVMLFLIGFVRLFGKPYLLWSVSSQIIQTPFALNVYKWVLQGATAITYRDQPTKSLFNSCGVKSDQMRQVADPGFTLEFDDKKGVEILLKYGWKPGNRPLVSLTPRKLRIADGESETHYKINSPNQYQQEIDCFVAATDWLWENGYQPVFIPMNTVVPDNDLDAARDIIAKSKFGKHALVIEESLRPRHVPGIYRECLVSFVARVHGSITSMLGNCPMMMYSFAQKHKGIMDMMDMKDYSLSLDLATPKTTIRMLENLISNRDILKQKMEKRLLQLQQDALYPEKIIRQILIK